MIPVDETESIPIKIETARPQTFSFAPNPFGTELSADTNQQETDTSSFSQIHANYEQNNFGDQNEATTSNGDEGERECFFNYYPKL